MKKLTTLLLLAAVLAACSKPGPTLPPHQESPHAETPAPAQDPAKDFTDQAAAMLYRNYHGALELAREALKLKPDYVPAHLVAGTALQLIGSPEEARPHLERAYDGSLEAGLQLVLNRESLGEEAAARTLLGELKAHFPDSDEVKRAQARLDSLVGVWPAPGAPGTPAADWSPDHLQYSSEILVGWSQDQKKLIALGRDGKVRWELACGGEQILDLVWDKTQSRAIAFTVKQGCLVDAATGRQLAITPPTSEPMWGFVWQGDLLAFSEDVRPANLPEGMPGYFGTDWQVHRLTESGGKVSLQHLYTARDGSRTGALSKDGKVFFSWMGNHGAGRPRLFIDGKMITQYENLAVGAEFALDPRDDRLYFVSYDGVVQAFTLEGKLLWQEAGARHSPLDVWQDEQGNLSIIVRNKEYNDGFTVYNDKGQVQWRGPGWGGPVDANHLMSSDGRETLLLDRQGNVLGRYPLGTFITPDGKAMMRGTGKRFLIYRYGVN